MKHSDLPSAEELLHLAQHETAPSLSIYLPTHEYGYEAKGDRIQLKNMLTEAEQVLRAKETDAPTVRALLSELEVLVDDGEFWKRQGNQLALFAAPGLVRIFRLKERLTQHLHVGESFYLKPLFFEPQHRLDFYLLSVSQNHAALYRGSRTELSKVELEDMPESLAEILDLYEALGEVFRSFRARGGADNASEASMFHGHGEGVDKREQKARIREYFQRMDAALQPVLAEIRSPLIFAGVDFMFGIFKDVSSAPIEPLRLSGNMDYVPLHELHKECLELVRGDFERRRRERFDEAAELFSGERCAERLQDIVAAAWSGAVDTLFVPVEDRQWGVFDTETFAVKTRSESDEPACELLDFAARHTFLNGGTVYPLLPTDIASGLTLRAVLRRPLSTIGTTTAPRVANA